MVQHYLRTNPLHPPPEAGATQSAHPHQSTDSTIKFGLTPTHSTLLQACHAGDYDAARSALQAVRFFPFPQLEACQRRQPQESGCSIDTTRDTDGNTPLMLAAAHGHGRLVKLCLRKVAAVAW